MNIEIFTKEKQFTLPNNAKSDDIIAGYNQGVLRLTIPKTEASQPKTIEINWT